MQIHLHVVDPGDGWIVAQEYRRASKGKDLVTGAPQKAGLGDWRHLRVPALVGWGAHSEACFTSGGESCGGQDEGLSPSHLLL